METRTAMFGAGCFWGVEEAFRKLPGVLDTRVGYAGGATANPTYEQVCTDTTGHAEVIQLVFDPAVVTYEQLVQFFFTMHDPTTLNRQGPDHGSQYRSAIFAADAEQTEIALQVIRFLNDTGKYPGKQVVTKVELDAVFYPAEEYHQQYLAKRGLGSCHI